MNTRTLTSLASAALVTGVTTLALAAPASAMRVNDPYPGGGDSSTVSPGQPEDDGWQFSQVATGAAGGLAVAGAGAAAAVGLRRHTKRAVHPA